MYGEHRRLLTSFIKSHIFWRFLGGNILEILFHICICLFIDVGIFEFMFMNAVNKCFLIFLGKTTVLIIKRLVTIFIM